MTARDEHRAQCIEAMAKTAAMKYWHSFSKDFRWHKDADWEHCAESSKIVWRQIETASFDALHCLARVCPITATEGMINAGVKHRDTSQGGIGETFDVMSAVGALTNPPEKKP